MYRYLHQYFAANKHLSLPGIGRFVGMSIPAEFDFLNKSLKPPVYSIVFQPDETASDENFVAFLSDQTRNNLQECTNAFHSFSTIMFRKLKAGEEENIPGIGSLKLVNNSYLFAAHNAIQNYYPVVAAEKMVRPDARHTIKVVDDEKTSGEMHELLNADAKKEQWWMIAAVLAAAGIAAIIYYHWLR